jgi:hypothetical protein
MRLGRLFASCTSKARRHFVAGRLHEAGGMLHSLLFVPLYLVGMRLYGLIAARDGRFKPRLEEA